LPKEQVIGYAVSLDVPIDLVLIFTVVAQRIKYLSHVQVGQVLRNLFRRNPTSPQFHYGANGRPRAVDDRFAT